MTAFLCHPEERSDEESRLRSQRNQILRFAQDDKGRLAQDDKGPSLRLALAVFVFCVSGTGLLFAEERAIPFWDVHVPAAIHAQVDGVAALETVRELGRFHRVQGSPGFAAAAEFIRSRAAAAGLTAAAVEHFPADAETE